MKNKLLDIQVFLITLFPILIISGPFLTDLALSIIGIIFLILFINRNTWNIKKLISKKIVWIYGLLCAYLIINTLLLNFSFNAIKSSFFYFRFGLFAIGVYYLIELRPNFIKNLFYVFFACLITLFLDAVLQLYTGKNIMGFPQNPGPTLASFFGTESILGSYVSRTTPLVFGLSLIFFKDKKYLPFLIITISLMIVFISGERTAYFYSIFFLGFVIAFLKINKIYKALVLLVIVMLITFISYTNKNSYQRIIIQTLVQMNIIKTTSSNNKLFIFSQQHMEHYVSSYRIFLDNPLFGAGVKNFKNLCNQEKYKIGELTCSTHSHNTYLQLLSETGIVGFLFFFIFFCYISIKIFRIIFFEKNISDIEYNYKLCVLFCLIISLWPLAPSGNVFSNTLNPIYYLPLGFLNFSYISKLYLK